MADGSSVVLWDNSRMANLSFTRKSQEKMVNGFVADFSGFQKLMEGNNVKNNSLSRFFFCSNS
jgi:hypothetical protein